MIWILIFSLPPSHAERKRAKTNSNLLVREVRAFRLVGDCRGIHENIKPHSKMQIKVILRWGWHNNNTPAMFCKRVITLYTSYYHFELRYFSRFCWKPFATVTYIFLSTKTFFRVLLSSISMTPLTPSWNILFQLSTLELWSQNSYSFRGMSWRRLAAKRFNNIY